MLRFVLLLSLVTSFSCSWGNPETSSDWTVLKTAERVKCAAWPLHEKDLEIDRIDVAAPDDPFLIAQGRMRTSLPARYWAKFNGKIAIDADNANDIRLGANAIVAGGMTIAGVPHLVVVQIDRGESHVEVRTVRDNIVRATSPVLKYPIAWATIKATKEGFWLVFEKLSKEADFGINEDSAESRFGAAFLVGSGNNKLTMSTFDDADFPTAPAILPATDKSAALAIWPDQAPASQTAPFRWRELKAGDKAGPVRTLEAPVTDQLESWTATTTGSSLVLAWVDGDTLVGQAHLRFARFDRNDAGLQSRFQQEREMHDVHASEPIWRLHDGSPSLLLLQWMDEESSLASYTLGESDVAPPVFYGIFPKGTRLMETFVEPANDHMFATVRYRSGTAEQWKFELCDFGVNK